MHGRDVKWGSKLWGMREKYFEATLSDLKPPFYRTVIYAVNAVWSRAQGVDTPHGQRSEHDDLSTMG